mmetsp:Transcript_20692/g.40999  ORF Transcript_20692/g.40999 Transcript_20692/m.40999 type:complete len:213 (-) Transcript_20692:315-953(-)
MQLRSIPVRQSVRTLQNLLPMQLRSIPEQPVQQCICQPPRSAFQLVLPHLRSMIRPSRLLRQPLRLLRRCCPEFRQLHRIRLIRSQNHLEKLHGDRLRPCPRHRSRRWRCSFPHSDDGGGHRPVPRRHQGRCQICRVPIHWIRRDYSLRKNFHLGTPRNCFRLRLHLGTPRSCFRLRLLSDPCHCHLESHIQLLFQPFCCCMWIYRSVLHRL